MLDIKGCAAGIAENHIGVRNKDITMTLKNLYFVLLVALTGKITEVTDC